MTTQVTFKELPDYTNTLHEKRLLLKDTLRNIQKELVRLENTTSTYTIHDDIRLLDNLAKRLDSIDEKLFTYVELS